MFTSRVSVFATLSMIVANVAWAELPVVDFHRGAVVRLASVQEAIEVLTRRDDFIRSLSPFDRQARLRTEDEVSESQFLEFVANQVLPWEPEEAHRLAHAVRDVSRLIDRYDLPFPETILLVKTTGQEEGCASYCRSNAIVLPCQLTDGPPQSLVRLLLHELFHILTSHSREQRDALYAIVGFRRCGAVELPKVMRDRKITNPDTPVVAHCIEVLVDGEPTTLAPILVASFTRYSERLGGGIFRYLQFRLLVVDPESGKWDETRQPTQPVLLDPAKVPDYLEKVGRNTGYIIHPEEILADNFVHMIQGTPNLKTPRIVEELMAHFAPSSDRSRESAEPVPPPQTMLTRVEDPVSPRTAELRRP